MMEAQKEPGKPHAGWSLQAAQTKVPLALLQATVCPLLGDPMALHLANNLDFPPP